MDIEHLVEQYVGFRRALGERFDTNNRVLRAFVRAVGPRSEFSKVTAEQTNSFLAGKGPITHSWYCRYHAVNGLYRYAIAREYVETAPLPTVLPKRPPAFSPYIFSTEELQRILKATLTYQRNRSSIEPVTIRALVLMLYGTAMRIGEAVALRQRDVDMDESVLTIRETKFYKSRLVPFGPRLRDALKAYRTRELARTAPDNTFLANCHGSKLHISTMDACFRRVCEHAGIRRSDGATYQPRLHDLRHTAAVHRVISWYRQGLDVQMLLPHLSVYLGHVHLANTQVYLSMTPELLHEASLRFERYKGAGP